MGDESVFDVVIFGFRNDVARERTLDYLYELAPREPDLAPLDRDTPLPQRLLGGLAHARAQELCRHLEGLGAQVGVLQAGPPVVGQVVGAAQAEAAQRSMRPLTLLLVLLLGATVYLWHETRRQPPIVPQLPEVAARLERLGKGSASLAEVPPLNSEAIRLAEAGQFRDAVDRLQRARRLAPDDEVLTRNLQTVWLNWGLHDLGDRRLDEAQAHLGQAAALGERGDVLRALGITYLRQGDYEHATTSLERALRVEPSDARTLLVLADTYLKQDKRPQALDLLERAKEAGAHSPDIDRTVQQLSREVDTEWDFVELQSAHFRLSFAGDEDRTAVRQVLGALEEAYFDVGSKFDYHPDSRTPVVLYTQKDFHVVTQTPDWAGAAFDGRIKIPVRGLTTADPNFPRIVRHEYAHSLIAQMAGPNCPVWLNEGLAVWAEETTDGERVAWAQDRIAGQQLFALDDLRRSFTTLPAQRADVAYAESYLAVHHLVDRFGARKIPALLAAIGKNRDFAAAFADVYPGDFAGFQQQFFSQLAG